MKSKLSNSRSTSTKTRIETYKTMTPIPTTIPIQEAHPQKQGLKLTNMLKPFYRWIIQEAHPQKQGLKRNRPVQFNIVLYIQEAHPQKQGLKHQPSAACGCFSAYSRSTSTKTRIETYLADRMPVLVLIIQEAHPQKQGLKPHIADLFQNEICKFKKHIHKNKD